jgi:hypothetical protein
VNTSAPYPEPVSPRHGDQQLVDRLREGDFQGIEYEIFANELARYAISVLCAWMFTGYIFSLVAEQGYSLRPRADELEQLRADPTLRNELANSTVDQALHRFREQALIGGGWTADGGASLTTYFTGSCLLMFPNEFRRLRRTRQRWHQQDLADHRSVDAAAAGDPAAVVAAKLWVEECLGRMDDRTRAIVELLMAGYSQAEIVELLGETSVRAVEGVLYRLRTREKNWLQREDGQ